MTYSLKHRVVSWVSRNLFDGITYTVRNGMNKGLRRRGGLGWVPFEAAVTPESEFWNSLDLRGLTVYDIGAFHGLLTIFFARSARQVVAWEPSSRNRHRLEENVRLNGFTNVTVRPCGLSNEPATARIAFDELAPGTSSLDEKMQDGGAGKKFETIELRRLDDEQGLPAADFIKIDVEGFELPVLQGARRTLETTRPRLFLEMHGADAEDKRRRVDAIVAFLWEAGYRDILHVESRTRITPDNSPVAARGHLYVQP